MKKVYIGCKIIEAEPMNDVKAFVEIGRAADDMDEKKPRPGYLVTYPGGYQSWSPKAVFEQAYREVNPDELGVVASHIVKDS